MISTAVQTKSEKHCLVIKQPSLCVFIVVPALGVQFMYVNISQDLKGLNGFETVLINNSGKIKMLLKQKEKGQHWSGGQPQQIK